MTRDEFLELQALIHGVSAQDHKVGQVLAAFLGHLARLTAPDPIVAPELTEEEKKQDGN